ncbi:MAG: T9SS type A sorting domain-containing protein [Ignavibacteria bacterium]|nr:T9SS type A sorting domain-containing protein [Ignavibacteria bacterium]
MWWMLARMSGWDGDLPVELTSFRADVSGNNVVLSWQTATEVNNYGFEVERYAQSVECKGWEKISFVQGAGNSNSPKEYSFTDNLTLTSYSYSYRLKQIDLDGSFTYSNEVKVNSSEKASEFRLEQNYPNPFNPSTMISYQLPMNSFVTLKVYNMLGQEITTLVNEQKPAGNYEVKFDASNLSSGVYVYRLLAGDFNASYKMLLLK